MTLDDVVYKNGKLYWTSTKGRALCGKEVGSITPYGYLECRINNKRKMIHHVVWFLHHGYWPKMLDHLDGDRLNNKIENLRECSTAENSRNRVGSFRELPRNVYLNNNGSFRVALTVDYKQVVIGTFNNLDEAEQAAERARNEYFGKFQGQGKPIRVSSTC
jgi:hypothetical protein